MNTATPTTRCAVCADGYAYDTTVAKDLVMRHEGKSYQLRIPALIVSQCEKCGEIFADNRADDQIQAALREALGVLRPAEIVALRAQRRLTQQDVCRDTGIAAETISRFENGHLIQSRSHDRLLRVYFNDPDTFREAVKAHEPIILDSRPAISLNYRCHRTDETTADLNAVNSNYALAA